MAAVLLRRVFLQLEYKDLGEELGSTLLNSCREELIAAIQTETERSIRRKIGDAVAELARSSLGEAFRRVASWALRVSLSLFFFPLVFR